VVHSENLATDFQLGIDQTIGVCATTPSVEFSMGTTPATRPILGDFRKTSGIAVGEARTMSQTFFGGKMAMGRRRAENTTRSGASRAAR
jgi:hypothetical protein